MKKINLNISTCFDCPYVRLYPHMDIIIFYCFKCKTKETRQKGKYLYQVTPSINWHKGKQVKIPEWCPLENINEKD